MTDQELTELPHEEKCLACQIVDLIEKHLEV